MLTLRAVTRRTHIHATEVEALFHWSPQESAAETPDLGSARKTRSPRGPSSAVSLADSGSCRAASCCTRCRHRAPPGTQCRNLARQGSGSLLGQKTRLPAPGYWRNKSRGVKSARAGALFEWRPGGAVRGAYGHFCRNPQRGAPSAAADRSTPATPSSGTRTSPWK